MPRWFALDTNGHLGVFRAEHLIPDVVEDLSEDDLDLTFEISRMLRMENRPVRGTHGPVRGGSLQMIASAESVRSYADHVEAVADDVIVARFLNPQRGRAAGFVPGTRAFGTSEAEEPSALERAHAAGACGGCVIDRADEDLNEERLQGLGLFVYECDEQQETLHRGLVPATPLLAARVGKLTMRCLRYGGQFAREEEFRLSALERPSRK